MHYPTTPVDLPNLPYPSNTDVQIFTHSIGAQYLTWNKPPGATMVQIVTISGGGGGGGANQQADGNNRGGGGGGACSNITRLLMPAFFLPDVLYVSVGAGGTAGVGAGTATNGGNGGNSLVLLGHTNAVPNQVVVSGVNAPGGGVAGAAATAGTGGTIPSVSTISTIGALGFFNSTIGFAGTAGGSGNAGGTALANVWNTIPMSAGTGGGGPSNAAQTGGAMTLGAVADFGYINFPTAIAAGGTATAIGGPGNSGVKLWQPFFQSGGTGGGGGSPNAGGNGGAGGIGCGGGGGGGGTVTAGTGAGGNGGNGMVLIISW